MNLQEADSCWKRRAGSGVACIRRRVHGCMFRLQVWGFAGGWCRCIEESDVENIFNLQMTKFGYNDKPPKGTKDLNDKRTKGQTY